MKTVSKTLLALCGILGLATAAFGVQTPLPGSAIPKFVDPLPELSVVGGPMETIVAGGSQIDLTMREFKANVMPSTFIPAAGTYDGTWVWGYRAGIKPTDPAGTYIGPVIVATRGTPTQIKFTNDLGYANTTNVLAYKNSTDQTLHWADPLTAGLTFSPPMNMPNYCMHMSMMGVAPTGICAQNYAGPVPDVVHLHGGEVPAEIDGGPDAWFTSDGNHHGDAYYAGLGSLAKTNYTVNRYPNMQEAAPLWFHPHPLGATRLNVYAGLAGAYLLTDPDLDLPANLPGVADIVPLVLQDRMFDTTGQLFYPAVGINPEHPFWIPEFVGDTIVVNGKVWPFKNVEKKRTRFLILNGSNARTYELFLVDPVTKASGPPLWVIGTDGGYLDAPIKLDPALGQKLVVMPGERYEVIIDFGDTTNNPNPSGTYLLRNTGRTPYPKGTPPTGSTLGQIIQFRLQGGAVADGSYNPVTDGPLRTNVNQQIVRLPGTPLGPAMVTAAGATQNVQVTRQLTLNEIMGAGGPSEILVNNSKWSGMRPDGTKIPDSVSDGLAHPNYLTELPAEGNTEVWEIVNLTADAHPIHLHLVQFQVMSRQNFNVNRYMGAYNTAFGGTFLPANGPPLNYFTGNPRALGGNPDVVPFLQGPAQPPLPHESGWKDTTVMFPGQVTRIAVRWAPTTLPVTTAPVDAYYPFDPSGADYVWHCHILDHEDNEMMRPDKVDANDTAPRSYLKDTDF